MVKGYTNGVMVESFKARGIVVYARVRAFTSFKMDNGEKVSGGQIKGSSG